MVKAEVWAEDKDKVADRAATLQVRADLAYARHADTRNLILKVFPA